MMKRKLDFTIGMPVRNRISFANEALKTMLKNSLYPIIVIDDASDKPDTEYLQDERVRVIYNKKKRGLTQLWNQLIKESQSEYIILAGDKLRPIKKDFVKIESKLKEGFALVGTYMIGFIGFSKHLTTKIGMMDEGYTMSGFEDTDLMNKLFINNLAFYISTETEYVQVGSNWKPNKDNGKYYKQKWHDDWIHKEIVQIKEDTNKNDLLLYKDVFRERIYLPFSKSELLFDNVRNYYKGRKGYKCIK